MADINISVAPYNDRFDPTKNRTKVLFRPDRPLQQSELNEMQSIQEYNLRQLGNRIFADGAMQTGMAFSVDTTAKTITVEDGLVYLAGKVRQFNKQTISFNGIGNEKIGVKLSQTVIDYNADPTLTDPTQGVPSYQAAGADRLEEDVILTNNDETASTIYEFNDGVLFVQPDRPEYSLINDTLATRTYEESGSYQVSGFKMWSEASQTSGMVDLLIDAGTAYVMGYRINKPTSTRIPVPKSTTYRNVAQESHTYSTSSRAITIGSSSVKSVNQVIARTQSPAGGITVSKGTADGRDALPSAYTSVDPTTVQLWTNNPQTFYTRGTDYNIVEENGITYVDWNTGPNGKEPTVGSSYLMTFEYDAIMKEGVDYKVTMTDHTSDPGWDTVVNWNGMTGLKPKDSGLVRVAYDFYLARVDLITLDKTGNFTVIPGQPDLLANVQPPVTNDPLTLTMGTFLVYPNSDQAAAINTGTFRLSMDDLQNLKSRLEDVEYNQAIQALENASTATEDPLSLRGVFADGFVDFSRMDTSASSIAMSFDDASITTIVNAPPDQMKTPEFAQNGSLASVWGNVVTAPYTEVKSISQPMATEAMNVNPYAVYDKMGILNLSPSKDNWVEETTITINKTATETVKLDRWWRHGLSTTKNKSLQSLVSNLQLDGNQQWDMGNTLEQDKKQGRTGTLTSVATSVRDTAIEYIRQKDITFTATNLQPMADNLYLTFDNIRVDITPTGTTVAGSTTGTIRADASGRATGKFTIPPNVRCGTREVVLQNDTNQAIATYTAQGTLETTTETITTTHVTVHLYDPLAQSFQFNDDRVVTSFDLYFASKSNTDNVIVQVRGLSDGGFPNQTVYAERVLTPAEINVSSDASVATKVALDDPLMCTGGQGYCVVIITDSNEYTMWIGTLGHNRVDSPANKILTQPYVDGVLFSSSNARTWTVHQDSDLKFNVYTAVFNDTAVVQFEPITDLDSDMLLLMASYLTPANTGCTWNIKAIAKEDVGTVSIDSVAWQPLTNYVEQLTNQVVVGMVQLQASFQSNKYISPMLTLEDLLFINFISETDGDYVTLNIDASDAPYNSLTMAYDVNLPQGCTVTPYYSTDGGSTWKTFTVAPTQVVQSADYTRYTYSQKLSTTTTYSQLKMKLSLHSDNRFYHPRVRRFTAVFKDET